MIDGNRHTSDDPHRGPAFSRVVEGRPIKVQDRELVPLVRVTSWVKRRASLRGDDVEAGGSGFVHMRPVEVVERSGTDEHRHAIRDRTRSAVRLVMLTVLLAPCLSMLLIHLAERADTRARVR